MRHLPFESRNSCAVFASSHTRPIIRRWAAKEAAYKALYPAVIPRWADLTVSKQGPKPVLSFSNSPRFPRPSEPDFDRIRMHLSVSHDADLLIAYVVAEVRETQVSNA